MNTFGLVDRLKHESLNCTGCGACNNICPVDAISMSEDRLGFYIPCINSSKCIDCMKCIGTCPVLNRTYSDDFQNIRCYAVKADDDIRKVSSSGGAFSVIAENILKNNGSVCGATLDDNLTVKHICVNNIDDLKKLRKSKYVQSQIGQVYREIKDNLSIGKEVLFVGTPCQVSGLYSYLGDKPDNLFTIDIICHGVPSEKMFKESLYNMFDKNIVQSVDFRDKDYGWECLAMTVAFKDGTKKRISYDESRYEQGFHPGMILNEACYSCSFCQYPRQGDISIGDFWKIGEYRPEFDDRKGVSAVIVNSLKGEQLISRVEDNFYAIIPAKLEWLKNNRMSAQTNRDPVRDRFLSLYPEKDFNRAVYLAQQGKYDIGIVGNWSYPNYGSALTYYSLFEILKGFGYSVGLISWPYSSEWKPYEKAELFRNNPYNSYDIIPIPQNRSDLFSIGDKCDTFILGSDQLLNNNLYKWYDKFVQMDWVPSYKRKIAYAASFGSDYVWGDNWDHAELAHFLRQFDSFSIRESTGKNILDEIYSVNADVVLDPVFLVDKSKIDKLTDYSEIKNIDKDYLFAYILDPSGEKAQILNRCSSDLNLTPISATDAAPDEHKLNSKWDIETLYDVKLEDWICCIKNSKFVITDSFHGMCVSILFHKPFLAIANQSRGSTRFQEILGKLGLESRLLYSLEELTERMELLKREIDYSAVEAKLEIHKKYSFEWLNNALSKDIKLKELSDYDILSRKINNLDYAFSEGQVKQWEQLEDHRLRLDGEDDKISNLTMAVNDSEKRLGEIGVTDTKQWEQLEDHRMRLDGLDKMIAELINSNKLLFDELKEKDEQLKEMEIKIAELQKMSFVYKIKKILNR